MVSGLDLVDIIELKISLSIFLGRKNVDRVDTNSTYKGHDTFCKQCFIWFDLELDEYRTKSLTSKTGVEVKIY